MRITVEVTGTNLTNIALAKLGLLDGTVNTNNSIAATIAFDIPMARRSKARTWCSPRMWG